VYIYEFSSFIQSNQSNYITNSPKEFLGQSSVSFYNISIEDTIFSIGYLVLIIILESTQDESGIIA
jgi:hypothetical protein